MKSIITLIKSSSFRTSAFYYLGSFLINFGNYLFHLMLIRLLIPAVYGEFLTYISFIYLLAIPATTISIFVTQKISDYHGEENYSAINNLFYLLLKKILLPFILVSFLIISTASPLAQIFKAHPLAFIVLGVNVLLSLFGSIIRSYITAFQQFTFLTLVGLLETITKILLTYILVKSGLGATGGLISLFISGILGLWICFMKMRPSIIPKIKNYQLPKVALKKLLTFSLIFSSGTMSLISIDILLVRFYLDPHFSGIYSGLSIVSRMIFFGIVPISGLLLPIISKKHASKKDTHPVFFKLGFVSFVLGLIGTLIFTIKPALVISILSGPAYSEAYPLLPMFALSMFIFGLNYFLLTYLIAIKKPKGNLLLLLASVLQPILIILFHQTIKQIIIINLSVQTFLLLSLLVYIKVNEKKTKYLQN